MDMKIDAEGLEASGFRGTGISKRKEAAGERSSLGTARFESVIRVCPGDLTWKLVVSMPDPCRPQSARGSCVLNNLNP